MDSPFFLSQYSLFAALKFLRNVLAVKRTHDIPEAILCITKLSQKKVKKFRKQLLFWLKPCIFAYHLSVAVFPSYAPTYCELNTNCEQFVGLIFFRKTLRKNNAKSECLR